MSASEYWSRVAMIQAANPAWRWGQTCFNVLHMIDPEAADIIRGTRLDPFYDVNAGRSDNANYELFITYIEKVFA